MKKAPIVCVTGASGFIGRPLCDLLVGRVRQVREIVWSRDYFQQDDEKRTEVFEIDNIDKNTDWSRALKGVDCIIHCAARAHVMQETAPDPLAAYREINVNGTQRLAEQAVDMNVRRLVFLSSIGVMGNHTNGRRPFTITDQPMPVDHYAVSKWEAEQTLREIEAYSNLEVVIVRPPLVYGPGSKGNFARLLGLLRSGFPFPLRALKNRRSLVGLDNLIDLLLHCVDHPNAAGQTFLVSDGEDLSTPELLRRLAKALDLPLRLWPIPVSLLRLGGKLSGHLTEIDRLISSLQVDISHTQNLLDWVAPLSVDECFTRMVAKL